MENAGAIFYAEQGVTGRRANEGTVAHEIAHQWFGDSVTERDWHHIWLSEGFATYFADLYYEHEYGNDEFRDRLIGERQQVVSYAQSHPYSPVVDTRIKDPNHLLSVNSYQKGGWVLHMLRNEIGTDAFWKGIRLYYQRFRDGNALTDDLRQAMEEVSGKDLEGFFDQWIFKPGLPVVGGSWSVAIETGKLALIIRQEQSEPFDFPLEIGVTTMSGEHLIKTVRVTETLHQFDLDIGQAVRSVEIDPNTNLLFINEFGG